MDAYILPNGMKIDFDRAVNAMLQEEEFPQHYLDTKLGKIISIESTGQLGEWVKKIGRTDRYLLVPPIEDDERTEIARDFIKETIEVLAPRCLFGTRRAFTRGGWESLIEHLEKCPDGCIHMWSQNIHDEACDRADYWLAHIPNVPVRVEFEGCGDCAICEMMRENPDPKLSELVNAFETENVIQSVMPQVFSQKNETPPKQSSRRREWVYTGKDRTDKVSPGKTKKGTKKTKSTQKSKDAEKTALQFKITFNQSTPRIWRRILVPKDSTFFNLHCAIQDAMGWCGGHLHAFQIDKRSQKETKRRSGENRMFTIEFPNPEAQEFDLMSADTRDERQEYIADYFGKEMKQCMYEYDFGDGWSHTVLFEREISVTSNSELPKCVAGKNACPPEDCGGVWGYAELQEILKNPKHDEHENMLEWLGLENASEFDPAYFDPTEIEFVNPEEELEQYESMFGVDSL